MLKSEPSVAAEQLMKSIEELRIELYETVNHLGRMSPLVLKKSRDLDILLNHYNDLVLNEYLAGY
ncbi:aspartyl-phosphate phosphatase Spo0E family protein [Paenibacillus glycanilyticus]|uniref:aspartyl-phosphate phosphatase Spo0E family protein n=1 Tax=Paenibacillus glycanilyticus TaxID=126569 RepID=UPI000FD8D988|nr:aspartyl-phosphate phosphatase Spo0E family protein [Paenibacillus glycanilyticus]